jgi:hypothetical protein
MAFDFGLITGGLGLLNSLGQQSAGRRTSRQGQDMITEGVGTASQSYNRLKQFINDQEAQGAYKSEEMLALAQQKNQLALTNSLKNASAQLANIGFKPGDSKTADVLGRTTAENRFANTQQQFDIQNFYDQKRRQDEAMLNQAGMNLSGVQRSAGQDLYGIGQQQQANAGVGASMGFISQFLGPKKPTEQDLTDQKERENPFLTGGKYDKEKEKKLLQTGRGSALGNYAAPNKNIG